MWIYKATNTINNKVYIGQTIRSVKQRIAEHKHNATYEKKMWSHFYNAIRKYGWDSFEWEIIEECTTLEDLTIAEMNWIAHYNANDREFGYNKSAGGEHNSMGVIRTDEQKRAIAKSLRFEIEFEKREYNNRSKVQLGDKNHRAKLSASNVCEIKTMFEFSDFTDVEIAEMYGVQRQAINKIRRGQRWSHLEIFVTEGSDACA